MIAQRKETLPQIKLTKAKLRFKKEDNLHRFQQVFLPTFSPHLSLITQLAMMPKMMKMTNRV